MDKIKQRVCSIPNMLSILRLLLVPVLIGLAVAGRIFLAVLAVSLLSDAFDGYFAKNSTRPLNWVPSWTAGEMLTYGAMIVGLYWIWPGISNRSGFWWLRHSPLLFQWPTHFKFGQYPVTTPLAPKLLQCLWRRHFIPDSAGLGALLSGGDCSSYSGGFEEMAITSFLIKPRTNVSSVFEVGL